MSKLSTIQSRSRHSRPRAYRPGPAPDHHPISNLTAVDHPRIAGHGPTLYQSGLPNTRRLELISANRNGAVAMHYRRVR